MNKGRESVEAPVHVQTVNMDPVPIPPYRYEWEGGRSIPLSPDVPLWRVFGPQADIPHLTFSQATKKCASLNLGQVPTP